ncbi:MAG: hypothetical protein KBD53_10750 [Candidatus Omnitrophica bacterium]|nr:hypothetical protein [Candidatus Omnitrophota bacterium]
MINKNIKKRNSEVKGDPLKKEKHSSVSEEEIKEVNDDEFNLPGKHDNPDKVSTTQPESKAKTAQYSA